jgi:hypothetical protein
MSGWRKAIVQVRSSAGQLGSPARKAAALARRKHTRVSFRRRTGSRLLTEAQQRGAQVRIDEWLAGHKDW